MTIRLRVLRTVTSVRQRCFATFTIALLAFVFGFSTPVSGIAKQSTISITTSSDVLPISIIPTPDGVFGKSGNNTVTVTTDNYTGYTLSISSSGSTSAVGTGEDEIESISSSVDETTFSTSNIYNNKLGYMPSQYITTSGGINTVVQNSNYLPTPATTGELLAVTNAANTSADSYTIAFGARVDSTLIAGNYTYTYVLTAIANSIVYNVTYDDNTTDTVTNMPVPNPQTTTIDGGTPAAESYITLSDAKPVRNEKKFAGWCDEATTTNSETGEDICLGNLYHEGDDMPLDQTAGPNITLYAVWVNTLFPIVWSQMGACEFHGATNGNITGTECADYHNVRFIDTEVPLYNQANYLKDYEIHFTIDHYLPSEQVNYYGSEDNSQQTFVSDKLGSTAGDKKAPGIIVRRNGNNNIQISSKMNDNQPGGGTYNYSQVQDVSVFRLDNVIYYSINNGPLILLQDITGFSQQFGLTTWFGAYPKDDCTGDEYVCTDAKRIPEATLSNMYIRLGEYSDEDVHTVNFKTNDGTSSNAATYLVKDGNAISVLPEAPTYNHHLFQGWFTASTGGIQVTTSTVPIASIDFYAHWLSTVALASIENDDIELDPNDTETIVVTNSSELEPYTFSSSNNNVATVNANTGEITALGPGEATITMTGTTSGETKTISVTVSGTTYLVTFDAQGGTSVDPVRVGDGMSINPLPISHKTDYLLEGWYTGAGGTGTKLTTSTIFNSNTPTIYYANWEEATTFCRVGTVQHTETCNKARSDQGCRSAGYATGNTIYYGSLITESGSTPVPGNAFTCDINNDKVFDEENERFYFFGTWQSDNPARLIYYKNISNANENYATGLTRLPDANTTGWTSPYLVPFTNSDYNGVYEGKVARFMLRDEAYAACNNSTSGFGSNGKCIYLLEKANFANDDIADGWWLGSTNNARVHTSARNIGTNSGVNAARPVIEVDKNLISLDIPQPVVTHDITFDPRNGDNPFVVTVEEGDSIGTDMPQDPTYTDHVFQRWYDVDTDNTVDASTEPEDDMSVYAEWKGTVALAQVASNTVNVVENRTSTITVTNAADLEDFVYSSSNTNVATVDPATGVVTGIAEGTATITITGEESHVSNPIVTVNVVDASSSFNVTFDPRNGDNTTTITVVAGDSIGSQMPINPSKTGYVFSRWYDASNNNTVTSSTEPMSTMTVYAEWKLDVTHAVITNEDLTLSEGGSITIAVSNAADLEPYTFSSEDTAIATVDASTGVITGVGAGTTDIIMTGTLSGLTKSLEVDVTAAPVTMYTVTFDPNDGSFSDPDDSSREVEDGDPVGALPVPTRTNYRFFGWYKDDDTFYEEVYEEETIDDDVTYYARWIEDTTNFPIEFAEINECEFNGNAVISGTHCTQDKTKKYVNSNVALFSTTNYTKDFEIGFTITEYDSTSQVQSQATLVNSKREDQATNYPGFVMRRSGDKFQLTGRFSHGNPTDWSPTASTTRRVKIVRERGVLKYSLNDGPLTTWFDVNNNTHRIDTNVWFGAAVTPNDTGDQRWLVGKLTDMYVKLGVESDYIINFDANGGLMASADVSRTITINAPVGTLPTVTPQNANYTFLGWFDESTNPATQISAQTVPDSNKTYVAHWHYDSTTTPVSFEVTNAATRGYNTIVSGYTPQITQFNEDTTTIDPDGIPSIDFSTWGVAKNTYLTALKNNFESNNCQLAPGEDSQIDWGGGHSVNCSKPDVYDTTIDSPLNVYLWDTTNEEKTEQVAYTKSSDGIIRNMIPGKSYYWEKASDTTVYGVVTATSVNGLRWLDVLNVWNVRDLGGLPADTDGNGTVDATVEYGKLIRGGRLNNNSMSITELTNLGVNKEYDVADAGELSPPDVKFSDPNFVSDSVTHYNFDYGTSGYAGVRKAVTDVMNEVINGNNIYFHCRVGADRTGTVAYLLEGLLGVPDEYRYREYEFTSLAGLNDRTRYYDKKSKTNYHKFLYMMGYVLTTQDIVDWYLKDTSDTGAAVRIAAFKQAMTGVSGGAQNNNLNTNLNNRALSSEDSMEDQTSNTDSNAGYADPLGASESPDDDLSSPSPAEIMIALAATAAAGTAAYGLTGNENSGDKE